MRHRLVHLDDVAVNSGHVFQETGIADARQLCFFLVRGQSGEIVFRFLIEALQIALGLVGDGRVREKLLQQFRRSCGRVFTLGSTARAGIDHQFVDSKRFFIKEDFGAQAERMIQILVYVFGIRRNIDAQLLNHTLSHGAIGSGALNREGAAKTQAECVVHAEFVALGVSAEIVVVIENEDASLRARRLAIEVRRREAADAAADNDQIVGFAGVFGLARRVPERAVAQAVSGVE